MEPECCKELRSQVDTLKTTVNKHDMSLYGDDDNPGIRGSLRDVARDVRRMLWVVGLILSAFIVFMVGVFIRLAATQIAGPQQNQNVNVRPAASVAPEIVEYTTADVAKMLGYSEREIQDRAKNGEIPGAWKDGKAWRFDAPSIDAFVESRAATAAHATSAVNAANADQQ